MSLLQRIWNLVRRSRLEAELQEEIETHLALIEDEERSRGSTAEQARRGARARFGSPHSSRERALDGVMATWLETMHREILLAVRRLRRSGAFAVTTVLTLALAIAANVSIFTVVKRVLLDPLPYPDADRLVELDHGSERLNAPNGFGLTPGLYFHYSERARTLESLAIFQTDVATLTGGGAPERIRVTRATSSLASVLHVQPAVGRWFTDEESLPGAPQVGVLSHALWMRRYGADPGIVGRLVVVDGAPTEVIGILPASFGFVDARALAFLDTGADMWLPTRVARTMGFGRWGYGGVARLRDDATVGDARRELSGLLPDLTQAFPGDPYALANVQTNLMAIVRPLQEAVVGGVTRGLWTLLGAVGLVLLVACTNVANLFLVRSDARQQEMSTRHALGAGRAGIARCFIAESVLLSAAGGLAGMALAAVAIRFLVRFGPRALPRLAEIRFDAVSIVYTFILSAMAALIFGLVPMWRRLGGASIPNHSRANTPTLAHHRTRRLLMGVQVATALLLIVAAGLMVTSLQRLRALDPGFNPSSGLTFSIGLPDREYTTRAAIVSAHQAVVDRLAILPGVTGVSATTCLPLAGGCFGQTVRVRGRVMPLGTVPPLALFRAVAGGYFDAMDMPILQGRGITRRDIERREPVVVIDEVFANRFFPSQSPIGEFVASNIAPARPGQPPDLKWLEVIGVVRRTPTHVLVDPSPTPQLYMPMSIASGGEVPRSALIGPDAAVMSYIVRSRTPVTTLLGPVRQAVDTVDPKLAIAEVRTLQDILDRASARMAFTMVLLAIAATVALALGNVGIYGTTSYIVNQRIGEIGLRLALGAEPGSIARMILWQGGAVAVSGVAVGILVAVAGTRLMESLLYGVSPRDPSVLATCSLILLLVALAACWLPARRAARLDPLNALRYE